MQTLIACKLVFGLDLNIENRGDPFKLGGFDGRRTGLACFAWSVSRPMIIVCCLLGRSVAVPLLPLLKFYLHDLVMFS